MDLLIFERKHRTVENCKKPLSVQVSKYYGILEGEQVIVSDSKAASDLNTSGCYGEFLQRREPRVSMECFENNVHQQHQQERLAKTWKKLWPTDNSLRLGMEEAIYLSAEIAVLHIFTDNGQECAPDVIWKAFYDRYGIRFVRRYATYRYFRCQGWIVRSGLHYGVDFMLYRDGPEYYHSSAAVRIVSTEDKRDVSSFIVLNRELNSIKKTLIEVTVIIPEDCNVQSIDSIHCISVKHTTSLTWKTSDDR
ncbi:tRNA intron endonuclease catalytic C-terminal domain family protein [Acanthocheilonema viteae]|uniref:tRNA-intron lyase n=1 Tax=Acanthocheilonema viteae TaxID=6277 RepID=A0A498S9B3_ACAVI|nr:unnamed protein product [Acanthocheilonema viteae]